MTSRSDAFFLPLVFVKLESCLVVSVWGWRRPADMLDRQAHPPTSARLPAWLPRSSLGSLTYGCFLQVPPGSLFEAVHIVSGLRQALSLCHSCAALLLVRLCPPALGSAMAPSMPTSVAVHPIVLLGVVDHYNRSCKGSKRYASLFLLVWVDLVASLCLVLGAGLPAVSLCPSFLASRLVGNEHWWHCRLCSTTRERG